MERFRANKSWLLFTKEVFEQVCGNPGLIVFKHLLQSLRTFLGELIAGRPGFSWRICKEARFLGPNLELSMHIAQVLTELHVFKRVFRIIGQLNRTGISLEVSSCIDRLTK